MTSDVWEDLERPLRRQLKIDVVIAALFTAIALAVQWTQGSAALIAVLAMGFALALRHVNVPVMAVLGVLAAGSQIVGHQIAPVADLAYAPLFFVLGGDRRRPVRMAGIAAAAAGAVLAGALSPWMFPTRAETSAVLFQVLALGMSAAVVCGGGWAAGFVRFQNRRAMHSRVKSRLDAAERLRLAQALDEQQERSRIATDMHDVVAHSWAVVAAQSDGARYALRTSPQEAERALEVIGQAARSAIADLRTILHELRYSESAGVTPGYDQQEQLFDRMRASGMTLRTTEDGERSTSPLIALTAYRLLSECLTNALKHGDLRGPVTVQQNWGDGYSLSVANVVRPGAQAADGTGHGIIGMTERASVAGGTFRVHRTELAHCVEVHIPPVMAPHEAQR